VNRNAHDTLALGGTAALLAATLLPGIHVLGVAGENIGRGLYAALGGASWLLPLYVGDEAIGAWTGRPGAVWRRLRWLGGAVLVLVAFGLAGVGGRLGDRLGNVLEAAIGFGAHLCVLVAFVWFVRRALGRERAARVAAEARHRVAVTWGRGTARLERERIARALDVTVLEAPARAVAPPLPHRPVVQHAAVGLENDDKLGGGAAASLPPIAARTRGWKLPSVGLLAEVAPRFHASERDELRQTAHKLELQLYSHGVSATITASTRGPLVDLFEAAPVPGQPLAPIRKLGPELEMQHAGLRIVSMPGSGRVGIEIPRAESQRATIAMRELLESPAWRKSSAALPVALGLTSIGEPVVLDLATCPHLLVAGATGSGKSVGLNAMLTSLLLARSPRELRLGLIDPKVVELARYRELPHLIAPPATELEDALALLQWACAEMDWRYNVFARVGVTDIASHNELGGEPLPRVVIAIDEFADLMMAAKRDVEAPTVRLAQKARAAGIHVILATQRPSVDVVTGVLKANFPSRVAFKVSQRVDSQTILDRGGAETLLGRGDSLCLLPALATDLQRVHSAYVSSDDVRIVCDAWRAQGRPAYVDLGECEAAAGGDELEHAATRPPAARDDALEAAIEYAREHGTVSTGKLRRALGISFERAAELMSRMDAAGLLVDGPNRTRCYREPLT
jgi:S-DNA-T family DNA segregation ATPase FtsK/SpoIIIE